jgi:catechol 2,3-dioxygenase-like lactoylglutathione lyase family enzyme
MTTVGSKIALNRIDHVVLHVKDLERSKRFYMGLLGMTMNHESSWQAFLYLGEDTSQMVALFEIKEGDFEGPRDMNHMAMVSSQGTYESIKADLEHAGVQVSGRPGDPNCIYFNDPDGHRLQIIYPGEHAGDH